MSRRRGNNNSVVVIYWRDIPAQVSVGARSSGEKILLHARFQHAIDRAAVVAGKTDTESYVAEWRRTTRPLVGEPRVEARREAAQIEAEYSKDRLEALVGEGGIETRDEPS